jgi:hypothetical protein
MLEEDILPAVTKVKAKVATWRKEIAQLEARVLKAETWLETTEEMLSDEPTPARQAEPARSPAPSEATEVVPRNRPAPGKVSQYQAIFDELRVATMAGAFMTSHDVLNAVASRGRVTRVPSMNAVTTLLNRGRHEGHFESHAQVGVGTVWRVSPAAMRLEVVTQPQGRRSPQGDHRAA